MRHWFRYKNLRQFIAILSVLSFTVSSFAAVTNVPRIIPKGKVTVMDGKNEVGTLTAEMPLPEKKILKVEGSCGVKLDTVSLIAQDKTTFAVATENDADNLLVHEGRVYFTISSLPKKLLVATPEGMMVANRVIKDVRTEEGSVKGYVDVTENGTGIGIIEGGAVVFTTREGEKTFFPGNATPINDAV